MALRVCPDCGGKVSDAAPACPHCGRPNAPPKQASSPQSQGQAKCPSCGRYVAPVVTNVGGGSCSFGSREKWKCPVCKSVMHRSGCFVATETYGDEDAIEVRFLRVFRDRVLAVSALGRTLIWCYYYLSPYLAVVVRRIPILRTLARSLLDILIVAIEHRWNISRASIREGLREKQTKQSSQDVR